VQNALHTEKEDKRMIKGRWEGDKRNMPGKNESSVLTLTL
jgi:hypothetical protein